MTSLRAWWIPADNGGIEREYVWPYINLEFELRLFYGGNQVKSQLKQIGDGFFALIFLDNSVSRIDFLDNFPEESVIVFLVSDETYSASLTNSILRKKSVKAVYRDYPLYSASNIAGYSSKIVESILYCKKFRLPKLMLIRSIISGLIIAIRQLRMHFVSKITGKAVKKLPLGYTGWFASLFISKFSIPAFSSLVEWSNLGLLDLDKSQETYFAGQRGSYDRQEFLSISTSLGFPPNRINETFGGPEDLNERQRAQIDYFEGLASSRFSLCPPGNYSSESFRFVESLLLHSLPIVPSKVISDPFYLPQSSTVLQVLDRDSFWKISEADRVKRVKSSLQLRSQEIRSVREDFASARNS
jgi:hypothetical protein